MHKPFLSRHARHTTLLTNEEGALHDVRDERKKGCEERLLYLFHHQFFLAINFPFSQFFFLLLLLFSGVGQDDSEYIDISQQDSWLIMQLLTAFKQAGFANQSVGYFKLLQCSLGTFVNASATAIKCIECPAGKILLT